MGLGPGLKLDSGSVKLIRHRWASRLRHLDRRASLALLVVGAGAVLLSGCQLPDFGGWRGATTQGKNEFRLWQGSVIAAMAVGLFVWALIFWSVLRYRKKKHSEELPKQTRYNIPWEVAYTTVPIIIVAVLFYFTVVVENRVDAITPPDTTVKVTAFQWGWNFNYVGKNVQVVGNYNRSPQMVLPLNETTHISLVSNDVVHGFYVAAFNFSRFAQPGVVNQFDFDPTRTGVFAGRCTQYCGLYHSQMLFTVRVVTPSQFRSWLLAQQHAPKAAA